MKKEIIPAIIAKNQEEFSKNILKVKDFVNIIQLDFMDGMFVPNTSINFDFKIPETNCDFEAHLMMKNPLDWIKENFDKVDTILVHFESCDNHKEIIDFVKSKNKRIGFVLNPETDIDVLKDFINDIDQVLIMTVNPGFYGSPFLPDMVEKVKILRKIKHDLDIEVDGGITDKTIGVLNEAGVNLFVSGSYIVKSDNIQEAVNNLKDIIKD
jgi:ribulose-phosphate 3-epimerase